MTKKLVTLAIGATYAREATQTPNSHAGWPKADRWLTGMGEFYESAGAWKITTGNFKGVRSWSLFYRGADGKVEFIYLTEAEDAMLRKEGLKPVVRDLAPEAPETTAAPAEEPTPAPEPTPAEEPTAEATPEPTPEEPATVEPTPEPAAPEAPAEQAPAPERKRGRRR